MAKEKTASNDRQPRRGRRDLLVTALMGGAALLALLGFVGLFSLWMRAGTPDKQEILRLASERYVAGDRVLAGELAERVELDIDSEDEASWIALRDYLRGAGLASRAQEADSDHRRRSWLHRAVPLLESAADRGFPAGRAAEGSRLVAESLFAIGRFDDAIPALRSAMENDRTQTRWLRPLLARALLRSRGKRGDEALSTIDRHLADATLELAERREAERIRIRALIELGRFEAAAEAIAAALERVRPSDLSAADLETRRAAGEHRDRLRLLLASMRLKQVTDRFGKRPGQSPDPSGAARDSMEETLRDLAELEREAGSEVAAKARLLSGEAHLAAGRPDRALAELTLVRQQQPLGGEAIAAGLKEIELLAERGNGADAVLTTRYIVRELGDPAGFDASLVSRAEFKQGVEAALARLRELGQYQHAIDMARALPPLFDKTASLLQQAIAYRQWAEATAAAGASAGQSPGASPDRLARNRYRAAGDAFAEAAELEFTTERYVPTLWSAIVAYQNGRHFRRSIELLEPYLRYEDRQRKPRGLIAYARAHLAEGDHEAAIEACDECMVEHERDPLRYDARLMAAEAYAQRNEVDKARRLLVQNLDDGQLSPSSPAWKDSLLTLGELLYGQIRQRQVRAYHASEPEQELLREETRELVGETLRRLEEAVQRYWPQPRAVYAAYLAGRTQRVAARLPRFEADASEGSGAYRRAQRQKIDTRLQQALDRFTRVRNFLSGRVDELQDGDPDVLAQQRALLRNCLVAEADTLIDLGRLEAAAAAYRTVTLRHMNEPLALEGILGQAKALRGLGRARQAEMLLKQARLVLRRIPNEWNDRFEEITRYDRDGWERLLTWMNNRGGDPGA